MKNKVNFLIIGTILVLIMFMAFQSFYITGNVPFLNIEEPKPIIPVLNCETFSFNNDYDILPFVNSSKNPTLSYTHINGIMHLGSNRTQVNGNRFCRSEGYSSCMNVQELYTDHFYSGHYCNRYLTKDSYPVSLGCDNNIKSSFTLLCSPRDQSVGGDILQSYKRYLNTKSITCCNIE